MGSHQPGRGAGCCGEGLILPQQIPRDIQPDPSGDTAPAGPAVVGVLVPSPVPHLDRVFDYAVPPELASRVALGVRVRVRFAGKLRTGFVVELKVASDFDVQPLLDVKGPSVVPAALAASTAAVAARYVGNWGDVISAAVPPRHARAERSVCDEAGRLPPAQPVRHVEVRGDAAADSWSAWERFCGAIAGSGGSDGGRDGRHAAPGPVPRGALAVPWGWDVAPLVAQAVAAVLSGGRRVLIVVPDDDDLRHLRAALDLLDPHPTCVTLTSASGPHARYGNYLRAISGQAEVVIGTRPAAFTPVPDLGLIWLWRDYDPSMPDPQAPYWHPREVTGLRSVTEHVPWIAAGRSRSCEVQRLVEVGWAQELTPPRQVWRSAGPAVRAIGQEDLARDAAAFAARLPKVAFDVLRSGLADGPVLVQVPRRGYLPAVACAQCREPARCGACDGPLTLPARGGDPTCARCGAVAMPWECRECGGTRLRAVRVGSARTAEELAQAFPTVTVVRSDASAGVVPEVPDVAALVVATPGAEPQVVAGRYRAAVLLDAHVLLAVPRLRAAEDAVARWCDAAALVDPGGTVVLAGDSASEPVQAMVRSDPVGWASREFEDRTLAALPPAVRMIALEGHAAAVDELLDSTSQELQVASLHAVGPVPVGEVERWLLRTDYAGGGRLTTALGDVQRERSRHRREVVTVRVDPRDID